MSTSWKSSTLRLNLGACSNITHAGGVGLLALLSFCLLVVLVQRFDAPLVLVVGVLLLAALPLLLRPELATLLAVFLLYINFPAILTKQHGIPAVVAGTFILLLGVPLLHFLVVERKRLKADTAFYLMMLLLVVLLVSSLKAVDHTIARQRIHEYLFEGLLLYWLIINVVRSTHTLRRLLWTLILAGGLLGALSLYQEATGSYTQEFGGLAYRNYEVLVNEAGDVRESSQIQRRRTWDRAQGPVNEPNRFAQILIVLLPFAIYLHRTAGSSTSRMWAASLGMLILAGIILTLSRGAFVALVLMAAAMMGIRWIRPSRVLVLLVVFVIIAPTMPFVVARINSLRQTISVVGGDPSTASRQADGATLGRTTVMLAALHVFLDHPVVGVGPGQFSKFYGAEYSRRPELNFHAIHHQTLRAHNLYLEAAAETGVVGLGTFLGIVGGLMHGLWRARRRWLHLEPGASDLATAFFLSLLAYLWTGMFLHLSYSRYYWILLALAGAALHILSQWPHGREVSVTQARTPYRAMAS